MKNLISILAITSVILFSGCDALTGQEIGRLPINEVSIDDDHLIIKETELNLKKDDKLAIWSEMDMSYSGDVSFLFKLEILKDGEKMGGMEIDPTDKKVTIGEVKTEVMGETNWKFTGRNTGITIEEDAKYTFRGILVSSNSTSLKINKAELVFKK